MDREMSSTDPTRAKVEDRHPEKKTEKQPWQEFHKDFESFKRAVDRAIERDPYGTLFGRRLRSPDTANNSSWTSWSWIFNPKEIKEEPSPEPKNRDDVSSRAIDSDAQKDGTLAVDENSGVNRPQAATTHSSSSSKTTTTLKSSHSIVFKDRTSIATEYIYDPISGRKIPQTTTSSSSTIHIEPSSQSSPKPEKTAPQKSFLETLFTENSTSIPVKVYKPHKVYGFTGESEENGRKEETASTATTSTNRMGSSRKREYDSLRLRTIGNNIDATNFNCEPWNNKPTESVAAEAEAEGPTEKRMRTSPAPSEDTPLFSGTTYQSKSHHKSAPSPPSREEEDFRAKQGMTMPSMRSTQTMSPQSSEQSTKIESALDRVNSGIDIPVKKFTAKLQSAIDRSSTNARLEPATDRAVRSAPKSENIGHDSASVPASVTGDTSVNQLDKQEDIDLLRASDVRAGTKAARVTKQAIEDKKHQERTILEKDFDQNAVADKKNLESVWKHVKQYPNGVVAKAMQSMGLSNNEQVPPATLKKEPKFTEPTVRPDVVRNLQVENHTQVFEPQIAGIVDKAKSVKRELHDVSLALSDMINERSLTAMANRDIILKAVEPTSMATSSTRSSHVVTTEAMSSAAKTIEQAYNNSRFIVLCHPGSSDTVLMLPMDELSAKYPAPQTGFNAMSALGSLTNPNGFIKHFAELDKKGFELVSGAHDSLVFRKKQVAFTEQGSPDHFNPLSKPELRATIANAEAAAQPVPQAKPSPAEPVKAAEVLDQIPTTIPMPGPSAPTAPAPSPTRSPVKPVQETVKQRQDVPLQVPSTEATQQTTSTPTQAPPQEPNTKPRKSRTRMTRQEDVFSGQQRLRPQTTALPDPEHFQKQRPTASVSTNQQKNQRQEDWQDYDAAPRLGFFARVRRTIRRTLLTAFVFGAGAYGIGVVAEGLQARAQVAQGDEGGPMKRLVLENEAARKIGDRQRVGIFSTESSR